MLDGLELRGVEGIGKSSLVYPAVLALRPLGLRVRRVEHAEDVEVLLLKENPFALQVLTD